MNWQDMCILVIPFLHVLLAPGKKGIFLMQLNYLNSVLYTTIFKLKPLRGI